MSDSNEGGWKDYLLPISILIAAVLISGTLIYNANQSSDVTANTRDSADNQPSPSASKVADVTSDDHIRGDEDAKIKIVEFSDLECPFCNRFHETMKQVVENYDGSDVAWVYRHFPLGGHANAMPAAEASECVSELAGEDAFWAYTDNIFANQSQLGSGLIESAAAEVGVESSELQECMDSDRHLEGINSDKEDAVNAGGRGTPYSVLITQNGDYVPITGAQTFQTVSQAIDSVLQDL